MGGVPDFPTFIPMRVMVELCQFLLTVKIFSALVRLILRGGGHWSGQEIVYCFLWGFTGAGVDASAVEVGLDSFSHADSCF